MKYLIAGAMVLVLFSSCKKEEPMPDLPEPVDETNLEVQWKSSIFDGVKAVSSFRPILFEDLVIASSNELGRGDIEDIIAFDRETGDTVWVWNDYLSPENGEEISQHMLESEGDVLFFSTTHSLYAVDKREGTTIWSQDIIQDSRDPAWRLANSRFDVLNGKAYIDIHWGSIPDVDSAYFMEYDLRSGQSKEVMRFYKKGIHGPGMAKPAAFMNSNGDQMVLILCNYLRAEWPVNSYPALYCYNITQDTLAWQIDSLDSYDAASQIGPAIHDGQAIIFATWTIFALDLETGEENWRWYFPESGGFSFSNWDIHNEVMYFKTNRGDLTALDMNSGQPIYFNDNSNLGGYSRGVRYHKENILFASKWLYMADAITGQLIEKFESPSQGVDNRDGYYTAGIVDRNNDLYYVCDGYDLICYKIKED